jgi:hypothetical protein
MSHEVKQNPRFNMHEFQVQKAQRELGDYRAHLYQSMMPKSWFPLINKGTAIIAGQPESAVTKLIYWAPDKIARMSSNTRKVANKGATAFPKLTAWYLNHADLPVDANVKAAMVKSLIQFAIMQKLMREFTPQFMQANSEEKPSVMRRVVHGVIYAGAQVTKGVYMLAVPVLAIATAALAAACILVKESLTLVLGTIMLAAMAVIPRTSVKTGINVEDVASNVTMAAFRLSKLFLKVPFEILYAICAFPRDFVRVMTMEQSFAKEQAKHCFTKAPTSSNSNTNSPKSTRQLTASNVVETNGSPNHSKTSPDNDSRKKLDTLVAYNRVKGARATFASTRSVSSGVISVDVATGNAVENTAAVAPNF